MNIIENVREIREKLNEINPSIEILAATKTQDISKIRECMNSGMVIAAGENRVQELVGKYVSDFRWDFIGRLQTNKVKYIVDKVELIHSVDRFSLAEVIEKESAKIRKVQNILIEINGGNEENKGGIRIELLDEFIDKISDLPHIKICGLMAVTPINFEEIELRKIFDRIYNEFQKRKTSVFKYLSMGMSDDYLIAAECGANIVRPGRGIFGERSYK